MKWSAWYACIQGNRARSTCSVSICRSKALHNVWITVSSQVLCPGPCFSNSQGMKPTQPPTDCSFWFQAMIFTVLNALFAYIFRKPFSGSLPHALLCILDVSTFQYTECFMVVKSFLWSGWLHIPLWYIICIPHWRKPVIFCTEAPLYSWTIKSPMNSNDMCRLPSGAGQVATCAKCDGLNRAISVFQTAQFSSRHPARLLRKWVCLWHRGKQQLLTNMRLVQGQERL